MPVRCGNDCLSRAEDVGECPRSDLRFVQVGGDVDIRCGDVVPEFSLGDKSVLKEHRPFHSMVAGQGFQTSAVVFSLFCQKMGMRCAQNKIKDFRMLRDNCREGLDDMLDPLARAD